MSHIKLRAYPSSSDRQDSQPDRGLLLEVIHALLARLHAGTAINAHGLIGFAQLLLNAIQHLVVMSKHNHLAACKACEWQFEYDIG